jgi:hypothetical protein
MFPGGTPVERSRRTPARLPVFAAAVTIVSRASVPRPHPPVSASFFPPKSNCRTSSKLRNGAEDAMQPRKTYWPMPAKQNHAH